MKDSNKLMKVINNSLAYITNIFLLYTCYCYRNSRLVWVPEYYTYKKHKILRFKKIKLLPERRLKVGYIY